MHRILGILKALWGAWTSTFAWWQANKASIIALLMLLSFLCNILGVALPKTMSRIRDAVAPTAVTQPLEHV